MLQRSPSNEEDAEYKGRHPGSRLASSWLRGIPAAPVVDLPARPRQANTTPILPAERGPCARRRRKHTMLRHRRRGDTAIPYQGRGRHSAEHDGGSWRLSVAICSRGTHPSRRSSSQRWSSKRKGKIATTRFERHNLCHDDLGAWLFQLPEEAIFTREGNYELDPDLHVLASHSE